MGLCSLIYKIMENTTSDSANSFSLKDEGTIELNGNVETLIRKVSDYLNELTAVNKEKEIYLNIRSFSTWH